jgi:SAM-dependent methyltransferase
VATRLDWDPRQYDSVRPRPPGALLDALAQWAGAGVERVLDLGCGTGLSTRAWVGRANEIVGVDPSDRMRSHAQELGGAGVRYVAGTSVATGLPQGWADVATCSQSLHWMDPEPTFAEVARVLRPGGVFAAYDYEPPPFVHPEVDAAFAAVVARLNASRPATARPRAAKAGHADSMRASGRFAFVRELAFHSVETADADRLTRLAGSFGHYSRLLEAGASEEELGLDALRRVADRVLGAREVTMWIGYRVRLGVTPGPEAG